MKLRTLLWAGLCFAGGQANAGLFNDDEARHQIQQVEARVSKLEETGRQQTETIGQQIETSRQLTETNRQLTETSRQLTEASTQLTETSRQQTRSMLDLQAQIEAQNAELRSLRGQNEELVHNLQDAEKRQKDFYIDLDTRLRHFESIEAANAAAPPPPPPPPDKTTDAGLAADDPALENRAYEAAHSLFKAGNHQKAITAFQELLKKFPESVYVPNANHEMGNAYFALKDYKNALTSYQVLVNKYSFSPKVPDAMLSIAYCQQELKDVASAKITLKQIIAKYPGSETADKAKERLTALK